MKCDRPLNLLNMSQDEIKVRHVMKSLLVAIALTSILIALFVVSHRYLGLVGDAELYAVQAMARLHPGLAEDVFLQNGSQDSYTIFSPIYARCIAWLGLPTAAIALSFAFKTWLFAASWALVYRVSNARVACLSIGLLMVIDGTYGGYGVFRYAEDLLTARSLAEALAIFAIALHLYGFKAFALLAALIALLMHPIMALPALLILLCLHCSPRINLGAAALGVLLVFAGSLAALHAPPSAGPLAVMDPPWLDVVRERSIFLFPHLWTGVDWATNGRPLLCLALTAVVFRHSRLRALSGAAILVGATGLTIALIAGSIGHIAIMIQAQPWRWMWIACFLSVLLSLPTIAAIYRDERCGVVTAVLLLAGWLLPAVVGIICMALALFLCSVRERIEPPIAARLRWFAVAVSTVAVAWMALHWGKLELGPATGANGEATGTALEALSGARVAALAVVLLLTCWVSRSRSVLALTLTIASLAACTALAMTAALESMQRDSALTEITAFADWRRLIPPTSNVYVAPAHYSAAFAWFTLRRPSYLSVDQSAGVVFSRATALEIKRRSMVLLPVMEPDWQLRTPLGETLAAGAPQRKPRALTADGLVRLCRDPQMGFVVSAQDVGIAFALRKPVGESKRWTLYDCDRVRSTESGT